MLKYIVTIDGQSGQVLNVMLPQAVVPEHKSSNGFGHISIHVTKELLNSLPEADPNNLHTLVQHHWYDIEADGFIYIGEAPSQYASYDIDARDWVYDIELIKADIRGQRNTLLSLCDWTQVADAPLSEEQKTNYATYRQALRDLLDGVSDDHEELLAITFPIVQ